MSYTNKLIANVFSLTETIKYGQNSIVSQQILKNPSGNITLFAFDKDQQLSEHTAPFNALVQILEGSAEIHISGTPYHLKSGNVIILPANIPHAVYANMRFKMLLTLLKG